MIRTFVKCLKIIRGCKDIFVQSKEVQFSTVRIKQERKVMHEV